MYAHTPEGPVREHQTTGTNVAALHVERVSRGGEYENPLILQTPPASRCKFHQHHGTSGHAPQLGVSGRDENAPALRTETYVLHAETYVQREKLSACTLTK